MMFDVDPASVEFINRTLGKKETNDFVTSLVDVYGAAVISVLLDTINKELGFHYATQAGITIRRTTSSSRGEGLHPRGLRGAGGHDRDPVRARPHHRGGAPRVIVNIWTEATDKVAEAMEETLYKLNLIYMMANLGARARSSRSASWPACAASWPIRRARSWSCRSRPTSWRASRFRVLHLDARGAGRVSPTLRPHGRPGYLTRRLVDVSQDVIVRMEDCGSEEAVELPVLVPEGLNRSLAGRVAAVEVRKLKDGKPGKTVLRQGRGDHLAAAARARDRAGGAPEGFTVPVRSVLKCRSEYGVCRACYGTSSWPRARCARSATLSALSPRNRSASPGRS